MPRETDPNPDHVTPRTIPLTATVSGNVVKISGEGAANLPRNSGAHRFDFTIEGPPGLTLKFDRLDTEDNRSSCPPKTGHNSDQIVGVKIAGSGNAASFTNNNSNKEPMDVCYQWHFNCSDPSKTVEPFDPIIKNGGRI